MFGFSKKSTEGDVVAVFDIGSGSIGGAIVQIPSGDALPTILKSVRLSLKVDKHARFDELQKNTSSALRAVAEKLHTSNIAAPTHIYCTLASPWYISENRVVTMSRESAFVFTRSLADDLIKKEVVLLTNSYQKKYGKEMAPEVIERHVMSVVADGVTLVDPIGAKSKSIEMNMTISLSPRDFLESVRDSIAHSFTHIPVSFSSFPLASYIAISHKYIDTDSFVLLDVAGEITDLSVVSGGVFSASGSFPFGKNAILNHVATSLNMDFRDAEELCGLYVTKSLEAGKMRSVEPAIKAAELAWSTMFESCLSSLSARSSLPISLFLVSDDDVLEWFSGIIARSEYALTGKTTHRWRVLTLDGPQFLNMCRVIDGPCDQFLMIEAIAISRRKNK
jgi:hypothetical protein